MNKDLGFIDCTIRLILAAVIIGVSLQQQLSRTPLLLWSLLALVLAGPGTFGYCPLYALYRHRHAPPAALLSEQPRGGHSLPPPPWPRFKAGYSPSLSISYKNNIETASRPHFGNGPVVGFWS